MMEKRREQQNTRDQEERKKSDPTHTRTNTQNEMGMGILLKFEIYCNDRRMYVSCFAHIQITSLALALYYAHATRLFHGQFIYIYVLFANGKRRSPKTISFYVPSIDGSYTEHRTRIEVEEIKA